MEKNELWCQNETWKKWNDDSDDGFEPTLRYLKRTRNATVLKAKKASLAPNKKVFLKTG
jgi:hypothetical protein